jgi:hypothetical protein
VGISAPLGEGPDGWAVAWIAGILAATALLLLLGVSSRLMAMLNGAAALAALGLAFFEGVVAFPRTLGSAELVLGGPVHVLGPGYYLVLIGGVMAVGAAAAMLVANETGEREVGPWVLRHFGVRAVGVANICVLGAACAGVFLPFVTLSCGFGCPPFGPPLALATGRLAGSPDAPIVIALLAGAALATAIRIAGQGKVVASSAALLLTLIAAVLVSFDSLNGATRVLGWPYSIPTVPDAGYYVMQIGTAVCVVLSVLLVTAGQPTWPLLRRAGFGAREPAPTP